jgi:hypothetical protein
VRARRSYKNEHSEVSRRMTGFTGDEGVVYEMRVARWSKYIPRVEISRPQLAVTRRVR